MRRFLLAVALFAAMVMFAAPASAQVCRGGGYRSFYRPSYSYYNRGPVYRNSYYSYYHTRSPYSRNVGGYSRYGAAYYGYPAGMRYNYRSPGVYGLYRF